MRYPIIILLLLSSLYTMAQSISGKITNEIGQPIANVTISHLETGTASVSDSSGRYTVALKNTVGRLNFSAIGYAQKEVQLTGSSNIDVVLQEDFVNLNEVVVIGYGSMNKKDLTGAVSTLSGEKLENINGTQLSQELQGQIPGVTVTRSSSRPGASADIKIRGVTTIGDSSPLIIVDGVPYNNIDDISSEDIKDITVLKDAASASIYGSRAAAGVILITTKNAPAGTTSLEAGLNMGLERIPTFPRSVGATRYLQMSNEAMWNDAGNPEGAEYPLYSQQDVENWETYRS